MEFFDITHLKMKPPPSPEGGLCGRGYVIANEYVGKGGSTAIDIGDAGKRENGVSSTVLDIGDVGRIAMGGG